MLVGLLFHELAHQRVFVKGETGFNEAYATAVERAGLRRWLQHRAAPGELAAWEASRRRQAAFTGLLLETRSELEALYASERSSACMRAGKRAALERLRQRYARFVEQTGDHRFDGWMRGEINNAHLALLATYEAGTDAFADLLAEYDGDFQRFHQAVERLARASSETRAKFLNQCRTDSCP